MCSLGRRNDWDRDFSADFLDRREYLLPGLFYLLVHFAFPRRIRRDGWLWAEMGNLLFEFGLFRQTPEVCVRGNRHNDSQRVNRISPSSHASQPCACQRNMHKWHGMIEYTTSANLFSQCYSWLKLNKLCCIANTRRPLAACRLDNEACSVAKKYSKYRLLHNYSSYLQSKLNAFNRFEKNWVSEMDLFFIMLVINVTLNIIERKTNFIQPQYANHMSPCPFGGLFEGALCVGTEHAFDRHWGGQLTAATQPLPFGDVWHTVTVLNIGL